MSKPTVKWLEEQLRLFDNGEAAAAEFAAQMHKQLYPSEYLVPNGGDMPEAVKEIDSELCKTVMHLDRATSVMRIAGIKDAIVQAYLDMVVEGYPFRIQLKAINE